MSEIIYASAKTMARAIQDKEVSAVELVEAHLARIEQVNPTINAVVQLAADRARAEAVEADAALARGESKGALHGVPFTLKDSIDTEGVVTTGGTLGTQGFHPRRGRHGCGAAEGWRAAFCWASRTRPSLRLRQRRTIWYMDERTIRSMWSARRAAAAEARALSCLAAGRRSTSAATRAAACAIRRTSAASQGLKPNSGRVPRTGHIVSHSMGAVDSLTQNGPMARYVEDLALVLPIISGPDWSDPVHRAGAFGRPGRCGYKSATARVLLHGQRDRRSDCGDNCRGARCRGCAGGYGMLGGRGCAFGHSGEP